MTSLTDQRNDRPSAFYTRRAIELIGDIDDRVSSLSFYNFSLTALGFTAVVVLYYAFISKLLPLLALVPVAVIAVFILRTPACQHRFAALTSENITKRLLPGNPGVGIPERLKLFADQDHFDSKI